MKILFAVSPRFPGSSQSSQGKPEPKSRPKGVDDGKQVNIPAQAATVEASEDGES